MAKTGVIEVKKFSYTYILFKANNFMESKIMQYGIILLHKYKVEQTELIPRFLFTLRRFDHFSKGKDTL